MLIQRAGYLDFLTEWKEQQIIKVITGIRRCGKSTLLELFQEHLLSCGVASEQVIAINFEDVDNEPLCGYKELYGHVKDRMVPGKMDYIFLDEIQHVAHFEKAVDSLFPRAMSQVPCLHEHLANAVRVKNPVACSGVFDLSRKTPMSTSPAPTPTLCLGSWLPCSPAVMWS